MLSADTSEQGAPIDLVDLARRNCRIVGEYSNMFARCRLSAWSSRQIRSPHAIIPLLICVRQSIG